MHLFYSFVLTIAKMCRKQWFIFVEAVQPRRRQAAQGLVEYALILVLIAVVVIGTVTTVGRRVSSVYGQINCGMAGSYVTTTTQNNLPPGHGGTNPSLGGARPNQGGSTNSGCEN
jgi:pilus assembly protein Flp/PilA